MENKPPRKPDPRKPGKKPLAGLKPQDWRAMGIGLELAAVIGGAAWLGSWADGKLGTSPWLALAGVLLGICGGGWHALKMSHGGKVPEIPGLTKPAKTTEKPGQNKPVANKPDETQPDNDPEDNAPR